MPPCQEGNGEEQKCHEDCCRGWRAPPGFGRLPPAGTENRGWMSVGSRFQFPTAQALIHLDIGYRTSPLRASEPRMPNRNGNWRCPVSRMPCAPWKCSTPAAPMPLALPVSARCACINLRPDVSRPAGHVLRYPKKRSISRQMGTCEKRNGLAADETGTRATTR